MGFCSAGGGGDGVARARGGDCATQGQKRRTEELLKPQRIHAKLHTIDGAGHQLNTDDAKKFNELVVQAVLTSPSSNTAAATSSSSSTGLSVALIQ